MQHTAIHFFFSAYKLNQLYGFYFLFTHPHTRGLTTVLFYACYIEGIFMTGQLKGIIKKICMRAVVMLDDSLTQY